MRMTPTEQIPSGVGAPATRVLVVDDDPQSAEVLAAILRRFGYDVRSATNANEASWLATAWHPAVALVDIRMPGTDGYGLAQRLRSDPANNDIVLIAHTAFADDDSRAASRAVGFRDHLVKGLPLEILVARLGPATPPERSSAA
jgi:two-component system OmpR family response regulator